MTQLVTHRSTTVALDDGESRAAPSSPRAGSSACALGSRRRRVLMGVALSLALLVVFDLAIGWFFCRDGQFRQWRLPPYSLLFTENQRTWLHQDDWPYYRFDATLGWTLKPDATFANGLYRTNSEGIRADREYALEPPRGVIRVATFGDSFTHGDDVDNTQTAAALLEASGGRFEALNFGVPGYGTDQAYLRYIQEAARFRPHVVVVGLMFENLQRNVSVFRPAYFHDTGLPLVKPRFRLEWDGSPALLPPPAKSLAELRRTIETGELLAALRDTDFWVGRAPWVYDDSPLFKSSLIRILSAARENGGRAYRDYYLDPASEPFRVTAGILSEFQRRTIADGVGRFMVLMLPDKSSLREQLARPERPFFWQGMVDTLQAGGIECVDLAPPFLESAARRGVDGFFVGSHYSVHGHAVVAEAIQRRIDR